MNGSPTHNTPVDSPDPGTPASDVATSPGPDADQAAAQRRNPKMLIGIVLGIPVVICLMLLAFAAPALNSGPKDLPVAVSGPGPAVEQITTMMSTAQPGSIEAHTYDSAEAAADAIRNREAVGGIALGPEGVTIQIASGAGAPYAQMLRGIGTQMASGGQQVTYEDLAPLSEKDAAGASLTILALPLIFGGMASAAALVLGYRGRVTARVLAALGIALLGGFVATAILQFGFGTLDGDYLTTSLTIAAGIASISLVVLGLGLLLGPAGIGLGAVLMLFISNPLSGMATGPLFLPQPWGAIGQYLPLGASGTALRSVAYFDGAGATHAWIVLACWMLVGIALAYAGARRTRTRA
ncbi:hypothetical protein NCCP2495_11370 [Dietzia sp. NCCP-2495]|uniref:ABC transporter permease n=1 Tax=Dietzia sp. NCCP-2495 TaxID=2934675 RepID=UPI00222EC87D|nr:ABC transporter permease [Dietzia sp. NCCP-2495]GLB63259.1 hypothetical protein NCCP2495_11370 [Dietzia sp. NCCP-2495]